MIREAEIIGQLAKRLRDLVPQLKLSKIEKYKRIKDVEIDIVAHVQVGKAKRKLIIEAKSSGEPRYLRQAANQLRSYAPLVPDSYPVIVAPYISERGAVICKENQVGFIDLSGNYTLAFDNVYLEKSGYPNVIVARKSLRTLFSPVSTRIIRVMLENPKTEWKLSDLVLETEVSLGLTHRVSEKLIDEEFAKKGKGKRLVLANPKALLDSWREQYALTQNEHLMYYSFEKDPVQLMKKIAKTAKERGLKYALALFSGASLVAPFIRGIATTYFYIGSKEDLDTWIKALDLRVVESGGNVHILVPYDKGVFYNTQAIRQMQVVGNIQLYLDLYNHPARGREQAAFLREQKIGF